MKILVDPDNGADVDCLSVRVYIPIYPKLRPDRCSIATTNKISVNPSVRTSRTGRFGSLRTVWQSKQFSPILFLEKTIRIYVNADRKTDETVAFLGERVQFYGKKTMTKSGGEDVSCHESSPSRRRKRIRTDPEAAAITFTCADAMYTSIWSKEVLNLHKF